MLASRSHVFVLGTLLLWPPQRAIQLRPMGCTPNLCEAIRSTLYNFCVMVQRSQPLVRVSLARWDTLKGPTEGMARPLARPWLTPGSTLRPFRVMASKSHPLIRGTLELWAPQAGTLASESPHGRHGPRPGPLEAPPSHTCTPWPPLGPPF